MSVPSHALKINNYDAEPTLGSSGAFTSSNFIQLKIKGEDPCTRNGRWNFNNKRVVDGIKIERWAVVNFFACYDVSQLIRSLKNVCSIKGVAFKFLDENWSPKFVVIAAQKNYHTQFFQTNSPDNMQPKISSAS